MAKNIQAISIPKYTLKIILSAIRWKATIRIFEKSIQRIIPNAYLTADCVSCIIVWLKRFRLKYGRKTRAIGKNCKISNNFLTNRFFPGKAFLSSRMDNQLFSLVLNIREDD